MSKRKTYEQLCHAVQTGAVYSLQSDPSAGTQKRYATGLDILFCEHSAQVMILVKKGILTEDEYCDSVIDIL